MEHTGIAKKVRVEDVKPNSVLARDVVTRSGTVILAKNTMLNNVNFTKLGANEIKYVYVWDSSIEENSKSISPVAHTLEEQMKPIPEKQEFKDFQNEYNKKVESVHNSLSLIEKGTPVSKKILFNTTKSIIDMVNCKSDIFAYLGYLKDMSDYTYTHCLNVSILCNLFGKWLNLNEDESEDLTVAGLLHDIGKTKIPLDILNKKGTLTPEEFDIIKTHAQKGYDIICKMDLPESIKLSALMHHEKINGSGYPKGLKGPDITKFSKIVAICDIYDAMTSDRIYRERICPFKVIRNFERQNFGLLDTEYLLVFLQNIAYTYVGSWAKLTDGSIVEIIFINKSQMSRPIVKLKSNGTFIDLTKRQDLDIENLI